MDVINEVRIFTEAPIIVLSVMNSEEDKIRLLDAGADDYITKPFGMGELLARIRTALRRMPIEESPPIWNSENLSIDFANYKIKKSGEIIRLTPTEFQILILFVKNAGKTLTHESIIKSIWGENAQNEMNSLRVHITQLRKKLEDAPTKPKHIITEPGIGYSWN